MSTTIIPSANIFRVKKTEFRLSPENGVTLFGRVWKPEEGGNSCAQTEKTLFLVHGASEHSGRYGHLVEHAVEKGWRVVAADLRGHGHSTGNYVHVLRFEQYLNDLHFLMQSFDCNSENTVLLGHSLGGLICLRYVQSQAVKNADPLCASLVLTSPYLGLKLAVPAWKILLGKFLSKVRPQTTFRSTVDPKDLTHDAEALEIRARDLLIRKRVSSRWFFESAQATRDAFVDAKYFSLPSLILQSGEDRIADPLAAKAWAEVVNDAHSSPPINFQLLPGWYHEVLREVHWKQAANRLFEFADQQLKKETSHQIKEPNSSPAEVA